MPHGRWPSEPRINEDGEGAWRVAIAMRRRSLFGRREGQKEGRVTIQVLDFERHDVGSAAGFCAVSIRFRWLKGNTMNSLLESSLNKR